MTPDLLEQILTHARKESPKESCGLVVSHGLNQAKYIPCRNVAGENEEFRIHRDDWCNVEDAHTILAVVHSHPGGTTEPSELDKKVQGLPNFLPWIIVVPETGEWRRLRRLEYPGVVFAWGISDCYSIVYDYFPDMLDFVRYPDFWEKEDLFGKGLILSGFEVVDTDPEVGDVLLFAIRSSVINHCGIYVGDGMIRHHLPGRVSVVEPIGAWVKCLKQVVRRPNAQRCHTLWPSS